MKTKEETANPYLRSELWESIFDIVRKMPIKEVDGDAMDHRSCTTEIEKVAQLYSDQQNKELREENQNQKEALSWADSELSRLNTENDTLRDNASENIKELATKDAEIQRLTKEVEELSWVEDEIDTAREWMKVHKGENSRYLQIQEENTRLRELLGRSKDYIFLGYVGAVELCDDIDNELNPKP